MSNPLTEGEMLSVLRARFRPPEWAFFTHVPDDTGAGRSRVVDALAMSLWPSHGLTIWGIEVKVSRADWRRELADPATADRFARYCDRWCVAVPDESIVRAGELPDGWGLMVVGSSRSRIVVEPAVRTAEQMPREMLAALLRSAATGTAAEAEINDARAKGFDQGREVGRAEGGRAVLDLDRLRARVEAFEAATGLPLERLYGDDIDPRLLRAGTDGIAKAVARLVAADDAVETAERAEADAVRRLEMTLNRLRGR